jgi:hypothetical protein
MFFIITISGLPWLGMGYEWQQSWDILKESIGLKKSPVKSPTGQFEVWLCRVLSAPFPW